MELICRPLINGIMAYWEEVPEATNYIVVLFINDQIYLEKP
jgi:hypothetical protein